MWCAADRRDKMEAIDKMREIAKGRTLPRTRMEAALFGYSEEEWKELLKIDREAK